MVPKGLECWKSCVRCGLSKYRKNVVFGRGVLPAEIVLVGEGPGRQEDLTGQAFYGKAGRILNKALDVAREIAGLKELPRIYITNVVGCRPCDCKNCENRAPTAEEAAACLPRLDGTIRRAHPKVVVFMGKVAQKYAKLVPEDAFSGPRMETMHPMACGYQGGASGPLFRPLVRSLVDALEQWKAMKMVEEI